MAPFALFLMALAFFHTSEFCLAALYNRRDLGWRCEHQQPGPGVSLCCAAATACRCQVSCVFARCCQSVCPLHSPAAWLFSRPYCVAMLAACVEHAAELRWAPFLKLPAVSRLGLAAVVAGECVRKAAMVSRAGCMWWSCGWDCTAPFLMRCLRWLTASAWGQRYGSCPLAQARPCTVAVPLPYGAGDGSPQLYAPGPDAAAAAAHAGDARRLPLGAAPGLLWVDGVGGGHPAAALQPAVHGGVCGGRLALLQQQDSI